MIDFQNSKTETLEESQESEPEVAAAEIEVRRGSSEVANAERKPSSFKARALSVGDFVLESLFGSSFRTMLTMAATMSGVGVLLALALGPTIHSAREEAYRSDLVGISEAIDNGAIDLPGSTRVSAAFENGNGTVEYKDASKNLLNSESIAGTEGERYRISGTVDHYTVELETGSTGDSYSYDSATEKMTADTREE